LGLIKNKGSIFSSFKLFGKKFYFVNVHLAAGDQMSKEREKSFEKVLNHIIKKDRNYDYIFISGDFNSRLNNVKIPEQDSAI